MVNERFLDLKPRELKKVQSLMKTLNCMGFDEETIQDMQSTIQTQDESITRLFSYINELEDKIKELEHWKAAKIREENNRKASYRENEKNPKHKTAPEQYADYVNDKGVEFDPYA